MRSRLKRADAALYRLIHGRLRTEPLDPVMVAGTRIGSKNAVWLAICCLLLTRRGVRHRRAALATLGASLTAQALVNLLLKPIFRRDRPFHAGGNRAKLLVDPPAEHSWPSAHAASSAAAFVVLASYYPHRIPVLISLAGAISYSRVYVGVHYPFDIAAGLTLGFGVGAAWLGVAGIHDLNEQNR